MLALQGRGCVGIPAEEAAFGAAIKVVPQAFVYHTPVLVYGKGRRFLFACRSAGILWERNREYETAHTLFSHAGRAAMAALNEMFENKRPLIHTGVSGRCVPAA